MKVEEAKGGASMETLKKSVALALFIAGTLLFLNLDVSSADTLLGKITLVSSDGKTEVYPLISGNKVEYGQRSLIRVTGGTFVVEKDSDLIVVGQDENLAFRIENGVIHFRIQPNKAVVSFNTRNGSFKTPGVVKAAHSIIEGTITVNEKETVLVLSEGALQALTIEGTETVNAGDRIVLASQAGNDENPVEENGNSETLSGSNANSTGENEEDDEGNLGGAAVFGGASAAAITGAIIGTTTSGNGGGGGDTVASPIE